MPGPRTKSHWTVRQWQGVIFSDETRSGLQNDSKTFRAWRTSAEENNPMYFQRTFKNSVSVMSWGCFLPKGIGRLVVCKKDRMSANSYITVIQNNLLQSTEKCLSMKESISFSSKRHYNPAPCQQHQNFLREQGTDVFPWPAQSPDVNIIEKVWLYI